MDIIFSLLIILSFLVTLVYQIFFSKINNKNIDKFMPKCILYNTDIDDSSPVTGKEFEILQKNNIAPNYLLNRKGTKK